MLNYKITDLCEACGINHSNIDIGELSDGYHTFNSLYDQRLILSAALFNTFKGLAWKSRKHSDGLDCFGGGWFIVGIGTPEGQYSYHYKDEYWDLFDVEVVLTAPEWDGHTDKDVGRLLSIPKIPCTTRPELKPINKLLINRGLSSTDKREIFEDMVKDPGVIVDKFKMPLEPTPAPEWQLWADREVTIACESEHNEHGITEEADFAIHAYEIAYDAYKAIMENDVFGYKLLLIRDALNHLLDSKPLTLIEEPNLQSCDSDYSWTDITGMWDKKQGNRTYVCNRLSSLFAFYHNGKIEYKDVDRIRLVDVDNPDSYYDTISIYGMYVIQELVNELFPIEMPYNAYEKIKIHYEDFCVGGIGKVYDTRAIYYAIMADNEVVVINRYFKETEAGWKRINWFEFQLRKNISMWRN